MGSFIQLLFFDLIGHVMMLINGNLITSLGVIISFFISVYIIYKICFNDVNFPKCATREQMLIAGQEWFSKLLKPCIIELCFVVVYFISLFFIEPIFISTVVKKQIGIGLLGSVGIAFGLIMFIIDSYKDSKDIGKPCTKCGLYNTDIVADRYTLAKNTHSIMEKIPWEMDIHYEATK